MKKSKFIIAFILICLNTFGLYANDTDSAYKEIRNKKLSLEQRFCILKSVVSNSNDTDAQLAAANELLNESLRINNNDKILRAYTQLASIYTKFNDATKSEIMLDSANLYLKTAKEEKDIAFFYYQKGRHIIKYRPSNSEKAYEYFFKSLYYYEQKNENTTERLKILFLLAENSSLRNDSVSIQQIMKKSDELDGLLDSKQCMILEIMKNKLLANLNKIRYANNNKKSYLDSILIYEKNNINKYEAASEQFQGYETIIGTIYMSIIEYETQKLKPDFALIDKCLTQANALKEKSDAILGDIYIPYTEALVAYKTGRMDDALKYADEMRQNISKSDMPAIKYQIVKYYELMSKISEAKGNYKDVIDYENKKNEKELEIRNNEIKMAELQFLNDKTEDEMDLLEAWNKYQEDKRNKIIIICVILLVGIILTILITRNKRLEMKHKTELQNKEKEETELRLKFKEEHTKKVMLEKYEALSDFRLKEIEIIGKDKELTQIRTDKEFLDEQIEKFTKKIQEYEKEINTRKELSGRQPVYNIISEEIKQLINKRLEDKDEYIQRLQNEIDDIYICKLKDKYDGNLTAQYVKYCICVAIGMDSNEIAECFSIEPSSVFTIKYRLKKKLGINNDDTLEIFLERLKTNDKINTASEETTD